MGHPPPPRTAPADTSFPPPSQAWWTVAVLGTATIFSYLDRQLIYLLIDPIRRSLDISDTQISLIQGLAFVLLYTLVGLPVGRLVDRFNRRNLIVVGVIIWGVATMMCGLADDFWSLFAARAGVGVGEAVLTPAGVSMLADCFQPTRRGRAVAVMTMCIGLGSGLSFLVGSLVLSLVPDGQFVMVPIIGPMLGWQIAFVAAGSPGLLVALLLLTVREPRRLETATADYKHAPIGRLLRDHLSVAGRALAAVYVAGSILNMMSYGIGAWSAAYFMRRFGLAASEVGLMIGLTSMIAGVVGGLGGGWLSDWLAKRQLGGRILIYPLVVLLALPFILVWTTAQAVPVALVALLIGNIICNAALMTTPTMVQELAPNEIRGLLIAGYTVCMGVVGAGLGPISVALITDKLFGDDMMVGQSLLTVAVPSLAIVLTVSLLGRAPYRNARAAVIAMTGGHQEGDTRGGR